MLWMCTHSLALKMECSCCKHTSEMVNLPLSLVSTPAAKKLNDDYTTGNAKNKHDNNQCNNNCAQKDGAHVESLPLPCLPDYAQLHGHEIITNTNVPFSRTFALSVLGKLTEGDRRGLCARDGQVTAGLWGCPPCEITILILACPPFPSYWSCLAPQTLFVNDDKHALPRRICLDS